MKVIRTWYTTSGPIHLESGRFKLNRAPDWRLKIEDPWKKFSRDLQSSIFNPVLDSSWIGPIQGESAPPAHTTSHPESQALSSQTTRQNHFYTVFTLLIVLFLGSPFSYKVLQLGLNGTGTPKQEKGQKRTTREVRFVQLGFIGHKQGVPGTAPPRYRPTPLHAIAKQHTDR